MDFRDKDGAPADQVVRRRRGPSRRWKECTRGRPCDYSGHELRQARPAAPASSGRATSSTPTAASGSTPTATSRPPPTSARLRPRPRHRRPRSRPDEYQANDPAGRALLKAADYEPPHEEPDDEYPFWLTTGRVVYHFHTRTKTGRVAGAERRRARRLRPDRRGGRRAARASPRATWSRSTSRRGTIRVAGAGRRHHARARLRPVPLRLLGRARPRPRRQRADAHRVGPGEQAAALQVRRRQAGEGLAGDPGRRPGRRRRPRASGRPSTAVRDVDPVREAATAGRIARGQLPRPGRGERGPPGRVASRPSPSTTATSPTSSR